MKLTQKHYHTELHALSDYDYIEIVEEQENGTIQIKVNDNRWRTPEDTIKALNSFANEIKKQFTTK